MMLKLSIIVVITVLLPSVYTRPGMQYKKKRYIGFGIRQTSGAVFFFYPSIRCVRGNFFGFSFRARRYYLFIDMVFFFFMNYYYFYLIFMIIPMYQYVAGAAYQSRVTLIKKKKKNEN